MAQEQRPIRPLTRNDVVKEYLSAYNSVCALLWLSIFGRVVLLVPITGFESVYAGAGDFAKWTQTVAMLEILHSAFGMINPSYHSLGWSPSPAYAPKAQE